MLHPIVAPPFPQPIHFPDVEPDVLAAEDAGLPPILVAADAASWNAYMDRVLRTKQPA